MGRSPSFPTDFRRHLEEFFAGWVRGLGGLLAWWFGRHWMILLTSNASVATLSCLYVRIALNLIEKIFVIRCRPVGSMFQEMEPSYHGMLVLTRSASADQYFQVDVSTLQA